MTESNGNGDDDENPPPSGRIGHAGNKPMLTILANYITEARHHSVVLETLYEGLVALPWPAPKIFGARMLVEMERHHEADEKNLEALRSMVNETDG